MGLPTDLAFRTKGQLAIDILAETFADGVRLDFVCGDEVYGSCTQLREYLEDHGQAYVLRVPSSFRLALAGGIMLTCKQAAAAAASSRGWEIRSAGTGSKGPRWYAWAWLATASARHHLLIRRHLETGELAFTTATCPKASRHRPPGRSARPGCAGPRSRPPLLPVKRDLSFTAALLVLLPAFRRFLPGVVPSGRGCSSRAGGPCARGARASAARRR